jgi:hypothetical protein
MKIQNGYGNNNKNKFTKWTKNLLTLSAGGTHGGALAYGMDPKNKTKRKKKKC